MEKLDRETITSKLDEGFLETLENISKAELGALIVVGEIEELYDIMDGGFFINVEYSPEKLFELSKMDGAIIVSTDLTKILVANTQLCPSKDIVTYETGTRHRTADRLSQQFDNMIICISARTHNITFYKNGNHYTMQTVIQGDIMREYYNKVYLFHYAEGLIGLFRQKHPDIDRGTIKFHLSHLKWEYGEGQVAEYFDDIILELKDPELSSWFIKNFLSLNYLAHEKVIYDYGIPGVDFVVESVFQKTTITEKIKSFVLRKF